MQVAALPDRSDPAPARRFSHPDAVSRSYRATVAPDLPADANMLALTLIDMCNWGTWTCYPSLKTIAQRSGVPLRTVKRWLGDSCPAEWRGKRRSAFYRFQGAVTVEHRRRGRYRSNIYKVNLPAFMPATVPARPADGASLPAARCPSAPNLRREERKTIDIDRAQPMPRPFSVVPQSERSARVDERADKLASVVGERWRRWACKAGWAVERGELTDFDLDAAIADVRATYPHEKTTQAKVIVTMLQELAPSLRTERYAARQTKPERSTRPSPYVFNPSRSSYAVPEPRARTAPAPTFHYAPPDTERAPKRCYHCDGRGWYEIAPPFDPRPSADLTPRRVVCECQAQAVAVEA